MSEEPIRRSAGSPGLRASDQDREQLISELNEHAGDGRLSTDELEERLVAAYTARTTGDLDALRRDLPLTSRQLAQSHSARRAHLTRRMIQESGGALGVFAICTVIWAISGGHHAEGSFWPVWVLLVFVLSVARNGWALYGPAPDLDAVERKLDARRQHHAHRHQRRIERRDR